MVWYAYCFVSSVDCVGCALFGCLDFYLLLGFRVLLLVVCWGGTWLLATGCWCWVWLVVVVLIYGLL